MNGVNLLPWRPQLRRKLKQQFILAVVSCVIGAVIFLCGSHFIIRYYYQQQLQSNSYLEEVIKSYDGPVKKINELKLQIKNYVMRLQTLQHLQLQRNATIKLFNDLILILTEGVYFTLLKRENHNLTIWGKAETNMCVAKLMYNIGRAKSMFNPILKEIKTDRVEINYRKIFQLQCIEK